jgi:methanogenic corrinoid protein MtbC1
MSKPPTFAASLLDTTLSAHTAGLALCLRESPGAKDLAKLGTFDELVADLRVRLQYLAEALALGHSSIYLQYVDWLRGAHRTRGLGEEYVRATHACMSTVLRADLPPLAWKAIEPLLAQEAAHLEQPWAEPPGELEGTNGPEAARLLEAILSASRAQALALALAQADRLGEETFVETVLVPLQRELGRLWQRGEIHVGVEHAGSRLTEEILARLAARGANPPNGKRVIVAATSGDLHEIGARMVAYRFERKGWDVRFLGANMPRLDLVESLQEFAPHVLALSVTLGVHLRGAAAIVAQAHALEASIPVLIGGPAMSFDPELWRTVGADALALDAVGAEREARDLADGRRA